MKNGRLRLNPTPILSGPQLADLINYVFFGSYRAEGFKTEAMRYEIQRLVPGTWRARQQAHCERFCDEALREAIGEAAIEHKRGHPITMPREIRGLVPARYRQYYEAREWAVA